MSGRIITSIDGRRGYRAEELAGCSFAHPDVNISCEWRILTDGVRYVLFRDDGRYVTFLEFVPSNRDDIVFYKTRQWTTRPRRDSNYRLSGSPTRSFYIKMPTDFGQKLKKTAERYHR